VIVPPTAAYLLTDRLWRMLAIGCAIAVGSSLGGYAAARALDVSIGGAMASTTGLFLLVALLLGKHGLVVRTRRRGAPRAPAPVGSVATPVAPGPIAEPARERRA
jgi:manganese/zinc/iron transport system permease protein